MSDDEQAPNRFADKGIKGMISQIGDGPIERLITRFENASQVDDDDVEFWDARDLQELLAYSKWDNFLEVVQKAKSACMGSGQNVENHFADVRKMVSIGSGAEREIEDIRLTRYACYLIAQNGDARKTTIAFAQAYFAIQTRRQEIADEDAAQHVALSEDQKRILLRDEIKEHNKNLASAAKGAGVVQPIDFAIFQTSGYKGLYGGLDRLGIQRKKGLRAKQNILDHMGSTELAANLFRATQTEEKLRRENIKGKDAANAAHYEVGRKVRDTIREIGGTMPEDLPPAEDIVKVGRRLSKAQVQIAKKTK
ncbi:MAG: DNA damage-inducible protein D [Parvibaculum sp.]|nr:DNA damage-inducible protein D [Parvibaculum sp.]